MCAHQNNKPETLYYLSLDQSILNENFVAVVCRRCMEAIVRGISAAERCPIASTVNMKLHAIMWNQKKNPHARVAHPSETADYCLLNCVCWEREQNARKIHRRNVCSTCWSQNRLLPSSWSRTSRTTKYAFTALLFFIVFSHTRKE